MLTTKQKEEFDWIVATAICTRFANEQFSCAKAIAVLQEYVEISGTSIIYVDVTCKAYDQLVAFMPRKNINASESGKHWALMLHGKVFDNLHPAGETLALWRNNFGYADVTANYQHTLLQDEDFKYWSYEDFAKHWKEELSSDFLNGRR